MRESPSGAMVTALKSIAAVRKAYRATEQELIQLLVNEYQIETPRNAIARALKSTTLQFQLADKDCFLWYGRDGLIRLVDRTECTSSAAAIARLDKHVGYCCKGCGMPEIKSSKPEILPELDLNGRKTGSYVHPACAVSLARLRSRCYGE